MTFFVAEAVLKIRSKQKKSLVALIVLSFAFVTGPLRAEEVVWGGVSLATVGDTVADQEAAYPAASGMMYCKNRTDGCPFGSLADIARDRLASQTFGDVTVRIPAIGASESQANILSPVIAGEMVLEGYEGPDTGFSYAYTIFVNLMVLRTEAGKTEYVSSFPYILRWLDFKKERQSKDAQTAVLRDMYTGDTLGFNLFDELSKAAATGLKLHYEESHLIAVTDVTFAEDVATVLEETYSRAAWAQEIANFVEANIALTSGQPILPSQLGAEGRKEINLVFEDASRKLIVPEPAYRITLNVERFARQDVESAGENLSCFMVATRFSVTDPFGDEAVNARLTRKEESCTEMKPGMVREDRVYFPESLLSQLSDLADYLGYKDDGSFLKRSISDQPGVAKAMKAARTAMFGEKS